MPKAAVEAGLASSVLPLPLIAVRLAQLSRQAPRAVNEGNKGRP
jgi:chemotaxis response regulator CheB